MLIVPRSRRNWLSKEQQARRTSLLSIAACPRTSKPAATPTPRKKHAGAMPSQSNETNTFISKQAQEWETRLAGSIGGAVIKQALAASRRESEAPNPELQRPFRLKRVQAPPARFSKNAHPQIRPQLDALFSDHTVLGGAPGLFEPAANHLTKLHRSRNTSAV